MHNEKEKKTPKYILTTIQIDVTLILHTQRLAQTVTAVLSAVCIAPPLTLLAV